MKVLVTGGSGGIGEAAVRLLRSKGHEVFFTYKSNLKKANVIEQMTGAKKIQYNFTSRASVANLIRFIKSKPVDGLVYGAAEKITRETILKTPLKLFAETLSKSIEGYYQISQAVASSLKNRGSEGSIVNILSSVVYGMPPAKQAAYVCSKYALLGLSRCQSVEFGVFNVRVNSVSPGMINTAFNADLPARFIEMYAESLPMRRLATVDEVAHAIVFLLSPEASYLQGIDIPVCGGLTC
ncbi:MAG: hypothetical protein AUJ72_01395 [Candidatus Omnitrophica bacterium CG1_02_46_14]|nr:MAG: hypothetical protein AUJ72_01395 [Candidatus Omnitrophica bacterium CG1_02_46_14]